MRIEFRLGWGKSRSSLSRLFRLPGTSAAIEDYLRRIGRFCPCGAAAAAGARGTGERLWLLDPRAKPASSEEIARRLSDVLASGAPCLQIAVGGPDGYSESEIARLRPDFRWGLGPMTLPHELAAVVAAEQVYRAWTILRRAPYHFAH